MVKQTISIHPPRAGRDNLFVKGGCFTTISIHPPRAGRDLVLKSNTVRKNYFNPPAPCGAGLIDNVHFIAEITFQSTRPVRGATAPPRHTVENDNFNPPAPCGAGRGVRLRHRTGSCISIHPPRAGRDTKGLHQLLDGVTISIHPPRAGRDVELVIKEAEKFAFQSTRPVRGGTAIMHKIYPMHSCAIHNTTCS